MNECGWTAFSGKMPDPYRRIDVMRVGHMGGEVERRGGLLAYPGIEGRFTHWRYEESESRCYQEPSHHDWHDMRCVKPKPGQPVLLAVFGPCGTIIDILKRDYSEKDTPGVWTHWCSVDVLPKVPVTVLGLDQRTREYNEGWHDALECAKRHWKW